MPGGNLTIIGLCVAGGLLAVLGVIGIVTKVRRAFRNSIHGPDPEDQQGFPGLKRFADAVCGTGGARKEPRSSDGDDDRK